MSSTGEPMKNIPLMRYLSAPFYHRIHDVRTIWLRYAHIFVLLEGSVTSAVDA